MLEHKKEKAELVINCSNDSNLSAITQSLKVGLKIKMSNSSSSMSGMFLSIKA